MWTLPEIDTRKANHGSPVKKDAQEWESEYIKSNAGIPPDANTLTVGELLMQYLRLREPVISPNTYYGYQNCVQRITAHLGDVLVRRLNRLQIESAYADMRHDVTPHGKPIRAATIAYAHRVLKAALNYAVDCDILRKTQQWVRISQKTQNHLKQRPLPVEMLREC